DMGPALRWLRQLGQPPYGHATPDGYSLESRDWSGSGQLTQRFEVAQALARFQVPPPTLVTTAVEPLLSPATRQTLAQANTPKERAALVLASPEFMTH
ncbi:MAG: DUF1800 domain-containing protein, partial [Firmicutes bacterium]|nr:DUF1800 domain-containing protein [Bacillota bacterium]